MLYNTDSRYFTLGTSHEIAAMFVAYAFVVAQAANDNVQSSILLTPSYTPLAEQPLQKVALGGYVDLEGCAQGVKWIAGFNASCVNNTATTDCRNCVRYKDRCTGVGTKEIKLESPAWQAGVYRFAVYPESGDTAYPPKGQWSCNDLDKNRSQAWVEIQDISCNPEVDCNTVANECEQEDPVCPFGVCYHEIVSDYNSCSDGDPITTEDKCFGGTCYGLQPWTIAAEVNITSAGQAPVSSENAKMTVGAMLSNVLTSNSGLVKDTVRQRHLQNFRELDSEGLWSLFAFSVNVQHRQNIDGSQALRDAAAGFLSNPPPSPNDTLVIEFVKVDLLPTNETTTSSTTTTTSKNTTDVTTTATTTATLSTTVAVKEKAKKSFPIWAIILIALLGVIFAVIIWVKCILPMITPASTPMSLL